MDEDQYTTWAAALREVPDPRKRRGVRHPWRLLLVLIGAALVCGQRHGRAIAQWVREPTETLQAALAPQPPRLPSEATLRRALRVVEVSALDERLGRYAAARELAAAPAGDGLLGQARDGKQVRGAGAQGAPCHLVSLLRHRSTLMLGQTPVADKSNEMTAAPHLLADRDLRGTVTTVAALLAQRQLAQQILDGGGHYLMVMVVKDHQPETRAAIADLFAAPPYPRGRLTLAPTGAFCYNEESSSAVRPYRLVAQDATLSRSKQGFDSP